MQNEEFNEEYNNRLCGFGDQPFVPQSLREQNTTKEHYFDLHQPFGHVEAFSTIGVVCAIAFISFLLLRHFKPKCKS